MKLSNMQVTLIDSMGNDLTVVNAARVSFAKHHDELDASDERLIRYLARHDHWTPFAQVQIQLRIKAPVFIARQWFKHVQGLIRNEVSRRYVDEPPEFYLPDEIRSKPEGSIKQGSGEVHSESDALLGYFRAAYGYCQSAYQALLMRGVCPEQARIVLPVAHMTEWVETGSLAAYARIAKLRLDGHAQKEIQHLSGLMSEAVSGVAPISWKELTDV